MFVTGLWCKYTGLQIVYVPFWHIPLIMNAIAMDIEDWENRRQRQAKECVQRYRRWLTAQQMNEKITWQEMTGTSASERITLLADLWTEKAEDSMTSSWPDFAISSDQIFHMLGVRQVMCMHIPFTVWDNTQRHKAHPKSLRGIIKLTDVISSAISL